jgi:nitroreductase
MSAVAALHADFDYVLTTTRSVRRRMDFSRTVERELIEACLELALQAPSGANRQDWRFLAIDDPRLKQLIGEIYRAAFVGHYGRRGDPSAAGRGLPEQVADSAYFLAENLHRAPVLLIPMRLSAAPDSRAAQGSFWASILPAAWSFMLAARSRGLVTSYTARGLDREEEIAAAAAIPYPEVSQAGLIAVGYPDTQTFQPARRRPLKEVVQWNVR